MLSRQDDHMNAKLLLLWMLAVVAPSESLRCVQCTSEADPGCRTDPGPPDDCGDDFRHCIILEQYSRAEVPSIFDDEGRSKDEKAAAKREERPTRRPEGHLLFYARTCVKHRDANGCSDGQDMNGNPVIICRTYCVEDGCNAASALHNGGLILLMCFSTLVGTLLKTSPLVVGGLA